MPDYRMPTAARRVPRDARMRYGLLMPARPDGSRIEIGLHGPVYRENRGMYQWITVTVENSDGTARRAWSRQYGRRNVWRADGDFDAMYNDLLDGTFTLLEPCLETA